MEEIYNILKQIQYNQSRQSEILAVICEILTRMIEEDKNFK